MSDTPHPFYLVAELVARFAKRDLGDHATRITQCVDDLDDEDVVWRVTVQKESRKELEALADKFCPPGSQRELTAEEEAYAATLKPTIKDSS